MHPAIIVSPTSSTGLAIATVSNYYSQIITASGGAGSPFTFTTTGPLDGLGLSTGGLLTGSPTTNGTFTFTITATDDNGGTGSQQYKLTVNPPIVVSPTSSTGLAIATVGNNYNQTITASGGAGSPYTFTTTDPLDGLTLSSNGNLSGSPTTFGTFTFTVTATDGNLATGARTIHVDRQPTHCCQSDQPDRFGHRDCGQQLQPNHHRQRRRGQPLYLHHCRSARRPHAFEERHPQRYAHD